MPKAICDTCIYSEFTSEEAPCNRCVVLEGETIATEYEPVDDAD